MTTVSDSWKTSAGQAYQIWQAGVDAVLADRLVAETVTVDGQQLMFEDEPFDLAAIGRIAVVGGGKAAAAMAAGLETALGEQLCQSKQLHGWINIPDGTQRPLQWLHAHVARPAGVNEPTQAAADGTAEILQIVADLKPNDLCIALISGGGSALLTAPREGITLDEKIAVTRWLSGAGANIEQLNTVRKQLSDVKGGRLLSACKAANLVTLVISDVLGDPLDTIASGPTVADSSTAADALAVLQQFDPQQQLPASIYRVLAQPRLVPDASTGCVNHLQVIGNNAAAVDGAGIRAEQLGYSHAMQSARQSEGQAEQVGEHLAKMALSMLRQPGPDCLISGGEPVVQLAPQAERGRGGRNQQLVLAALGWLIQHGELTSEERARVTILSGGTDGEDGPTDAAGAFFNAEVWSRAEAQQLDWQDYLRRNDAYSFFEACGGLILTGPTNTNVCDVRVVTIAK
ncbi:glycerate kinase type-2 family protein [Rosistilla oblonga]|uniref:Hydroxypyruvate reductase n=1 Tax=Rosistilla oblonga TaxID=2527990 RepID=A0A518IRW7_9BACT|nr:DUF4147 domain-containing protein [Rosistilla oblonga]QDV55793.1 Putative hydroxypyruvate reductase [Rosistilla oblonga]